MRSSLAVAGNRSNSLELNLADGSKPKAAQQLAEFIKRGATLSFFIPSQSKWCFWGLVFRKDIDKAA
jgi:hypothetical protein